MNRSKLKINKFREQRKSYQNRNIVILKRSENVVQALSLPKIMNLNPRSALNKLEEIKVFIEEEEIDCAFISENYDRENNGLDENLEIENFTVISNIYQRQEKGGRPALVVKNSKYTVQDLTNTVVQLPWGVEVTWALITPKDVTCSEHSFRMHLLQTKLKKENRSLRSHCRNIQLSQLKVWKRLILVTGWRHK